MQVLHSDEQFMEFNSEMSSENVAGYYCNHSYTLR